MSGENPGVPVEARRDPLAARTVTDTDSDSLPLEPTKPSPHTGRFPGYPVRTAAGRKEPVVLMEEISLPADGEATTGDLVLPESARSVVLFAHGSGSSRHSRRNKAVAEVLQEAGLATVLMDLLTPGEERVDEATAEHRFDIDLLGQRLVTALEWLRIHPPTAELPVGLFGASTGAAAALVAAAERPTYVHRVVSRGGRPDLAEGALPRVRAPVLLLVGGADTEVLRMNRTAAARLEVPHRVHVVPGATHLFEEPGTLEEAAGEARDWFLDVDVGRARTGRSQH